MLDFGLVSLCCSCAGIFGAGRWAVLGAGNSAGPGDLVPGVEQVASSLQRCEAGRQAAPGQVAAGLGAGDRCACPDSAPNPR